jgi:hypothetical protein
MATYDQNIEAMVDAALLLQLKVDKRHIDGLSMALASLNFLQAFGRTTAVPLNKITRQSIISHITGRRVTATHVKRARRFVESLLKSKAQPAVAQLLSRQIASASLLTGRSRGTRARAARAPHRGR